MPSASPAISVRLPFQASAVNGCGPGSVPRAAAGGWALAWLEPSGYGGGVPGFGDQREVELLVQAGFTPVEAIHIATENGAKFLRMDKTIGTLAPGKDADLMVIHGDPAKNINDIEKVEIVFKNGIGYDSAKLIQDCLERVGLN